MIKSNTHSRHYEHVWTHNEHRHCGCVVGSSREMWRTYSSDTRVGERKLGGPIRHCILLNLVWNVMAHGEAREGNGKGNRQLEWVAITLALCLGHIVYPALLPTIKTYDLEDRTALLLSRRYCTVYHAYPSRRALHLFLAGCRL